MSKKKTLKRQQIAKAAENGEECVRGNCPEKAIDYYIEAYELARQVQDDKLERSCALNLGAAYIEAGKAVEAIDKLSKARPPEGVEDPAYNGDLYFNFAKAYKEQNKFGDAAKYYERASEEFRKTDHEKQIECLTERANLYAARNNDAKVMEIYQRISNIYNFHGNRLEQVAILCKIAGIQTAKGDKKPTLDTANKASEILQAFIRIEEDELSDINEREGFISNELGLVYFQLQKYDSAKFWFERALSVAKSSPRDKHIEALVLQNLGATHGLQKKYSSAVAYHQQAAEAFAQLKNRLCEGHCYHNLGVAHLQQDNIDEAETAFNHALHASRNSGDSNTQWQTLESLGTIKLFKKHYEGAQKCFSELLKALPDDKQEIKERVQKKLNKAETFKQQLTRTQRRGERSCPSGDLTITATNPSSSSLHAMNRNSEEGLPTMKKGNSFCPVSPDETPTERKKQAEHLRKKELSKEKEDSLSVNDGENIEKEEKYEEKMTEQQKKEETHKKSLKERKSTSTPLSTDETNLEERQQKSHNNDPGEGTATPLPKEKKKHASLPPDSKKEAQKKKPLLNRFAVLFNCTPMDQDSDSMIASK